MNSKHYPNKEFSVLGDERLHSHNSMTSFPAPVVAWPPLQVLRHRPEVMIVVEQKVEKL